MSPKSSSLSAACSLHEVGEKTEAMSSFIVGAQAHIRAEALMAIPVAVVAGWGHPLPYYHHGVYLQPVGLQQTSIPLEKQTEPSSSNQIELHIPIPYRYSPTRNVTTAADGQTEILAQPLNTGQILRIRQQRDSTNPRKRSLVGSVSPLSSQSDTFESSEQSFSPVIDGSNRTMPPSIDRFQALDEFDHHDQSTTEMEYTTRRTKSRAIAIKRDSRRRTEFDENGSQQSSAERMYDWATWRMYNRIVDYRQRHPLNYKSYTHCNKGRCESGDDVYLLKSDRTDAAVPQIRPTPLRLSDYALEDEIFEMDL